MLISIPVSSSVIMSGIIFFATLPVPVPCLRYKHVLTCNHIAHIFLLFWLISYSDFCKCTYRSFETQRKYSTDVIINSFLSDCVQHTL